MLIVLIAWLYVALMMALAEALHPTSHWWGGVMTFLLYGVAPVSLVLYLLTTPMRRKARAQAEAAAAPTSTEQADGRGHAAGDAVAPERKEP
jgi:membrane protein implicated in regulation of membrane protease activity